MGSGGPGAIAQAVRLGASEGAGSKMDLSVLDIEAESLSWARRMAENARCRNCMLSDPFHCEYGMNRKTPHQQSREPFTGLPDSEGAYVRFIGSWILIQRTTAWALRSRGPRTFRIFR